MIRLAFAAFCVTALCVTVLAGCGGGAGGGGGGTAGAVTFVHVASAANQSGIRTVLNHPSINGDANARLIVTKSYAPGLVTSAYAPSVDYDGPTGRWNILNDESTFLQAVPPGASYVVTSDPTALSHTVDAGNLADAGTATVVDDPLLNNVPNAILVATHNLTPTGFFSGDGYVESPIGFAYDGATGRWKIFVESGLGGRLTIGDTFNVAVRPPSATALRHVVTAANIVSDYQTSTSVARDTAMHVMHCATQVGGGPYIFNDDVLMVYVDQVHFRNAIVNVTATPMTVSDEFFVWIP